jgi:penicillin amidase
VVAGSLTASGSALVSNDMHLPLSVPNIWYRASFVLADERGNERRITGVSLPGGPVMIVGSNGEVGWGFTNTLGDWSDLVVIEPAPGDPGSYLTPEGPRAFERHSETLVVRDAEDEALEVVETIWGPLVDRDHRGRQRALRWVAHEPRAANIEIQRMETASGVQEALEIANRAGVPAQNFVVGDRDGQVAWTVIGPIPRRFGQDGRLPGSWASGERGWAGWLAPAEYPRVVDPPTGRLWSANSRNVDGDMLAKIGDGGYVNGARARQIRDDLFASNRFSERDMLAIQLDHRALFLTPWRDLLLQTLDAQATQRDPRRSRLRTFVERWGGHAAVDSVGYRVVREFRLAVAQRAFTALIQDCIEADPGFDFGRAGRQQEGPLWQLVTARPPHLIDPRYESWDALLLDAVDQVLDNAAASNTALDRYTWGAYNTADIRHPMSRFLPILSPWLDMPAEPLAGDSNMPRSQTHAYGVSQRMNVTPGHEEDGIFHMPTGQSAHPLSPFFGLGHDAWVKGEPTPFLPGPPAYVLQLTPGG